MYGYTHGKTLMQRTMESKYLNVFEVQSKILQKLMVEVIMIIVGYQWDQINMKN